jgi:copper oxidase (laccase) domain-containing protein
METVPMLEPFQSSLLSQQDSLRHGFFTRQGGVSQGLLASLNTRDSAEEIKENLYENYSRLSKWFGLTSEKIIRVKQVHGKKVLWVEHGASSFSSYDDCLVKSLNAAKSSKTQSFLRV